ncbi:MAG: histidine phosphatase family protein [Firmicutes bacterium]|nr:histidine phosphatase family protein [Bacillota bacterium]
MKIYILRHGRTEANERKLYAGASDWPVSKDGLKDLEELKARLDYSLPDGTDLYTSGMQRTEDTIKAFYGPAPHVKVSGLAERNFGIFEDLPYETISKMPEFDKWMQDLYGYVIPEGESFSGLQSRVLSAFRGLMDRGRDFLVVIHGGPIGAIMADLFPGEGREYYQWQPENGKGYLITAEEGKALSFESFPKE